MNEERDASSARVVLHDQCVGLSRLFSLLPDRQRPRLDILYRPERGGLQLQFKGEALGMPEQTLFFVLLEMAQECFASEPSGAVLNEVSDRPYARELWSTLYRDIDVPPVETLCFSTTWHELALRCGFSIGGAIHKLIRERIKRLCECIVWESYPEKGLEFQSYLVAMVRGEDRKVHIALNVRLADAIRDQRYMPVSLTERLSLGNVGQAVHAFLSMWLRKGEQQKIKLETLAGRIWFEESGQPAKSKRILPSGSVRRRRSELRAALRAIDQLSGWTILNINEQMVTVQRHKSYMVSHDSPQSVRKETSVRKTTCPKANVHLALPEQKVQRKANNGNGFQPIDVSALFSS